mgnify:CR=1 FL=1
MQLSIKYDFQKTHSFVFIFHKVITSLQKLQDRNFVSLHLLGIVPFTHAYLSLVMVTSLVKFMRGSESVLSTPRENYHRFQ